MIIKKENEGPTVSSPVNSNSKHVHFAPTASFNGELHPVKKINHSRYQQQIKADECDRLNAMFTKEEQLVFTSQNNYYNVPNPNNYHQTIDLHFTLSEILGFLTDELIRLELLKECPWLVGEAVNHVLCDTDYRKIDICFYYNFDEELAKPQIDELTIIHAVLKSFIKSKWVITPLPEESIFDWLVDIIFLRHIEKTNGCLTVTIGKINLKFVPFKNRSKHILDTFCFHIPLKCGSERPIPKGICCMDTHYWCTQEPFEPYLTKLKCRTLVLKDSNFLTRNSESFVWHVAKHMTQGFKIESADKQSISQISSLAWQHIAALYPFNTSDIKKFQNQFQQHQLNHYSDNTLGRVFDFLNLLFFLTQSSEVLNDDRQFYIQYLAKAWQNFPIPNHPQKMHFLEPLIKLIEADPSQIKDLLAFIQGLFFYSWLDPNNHMNSYTFPFSEDSQTPRPYLSMPHRGSQYYLALNGSPIDVAKNWLLSWRKLEAKYAAMGAQFETYFQQLGEGVGFAKQLFNKEVRRTTIHTLMQAFQKAPISSVLSHQYQNKISVLHFYDFLIKEMNDGLDLRQLMVLRTNYQLKHCLKVLGQKKPKISSFLKSLLTVPLDVNQINTIINGCKGLICELATDTSPEVLSIRSALSDIINFYCQFIIQKQLHFGHNPKQLNDIMGMLLHDPNRQLISLPIYSAATALVKETFHPRFLENSNYFQNFLKLLHQTNVWEPKALLDECENYLNHPQNAFDILQNISNILKNTHAVDTTEGWGIRKPQSDILVHFLERLIVDCSKQAAATNPKIFHCLYEVLHFAHIQGLISDERACICAWRILSCIKLELIRSTPEIIPATIAIIKKIMLLENRSDSSLLSDIHNLLNLILKEAVLTVPELLQNENDFNEDCAASNLYLALKAIEKGFVGKDVGFACLALVQSALKKQEGFSLRQAYEIVLIALEKGLQFTTEEASTIILLAHQLLTIDPKHCESGMCNSFYREIGLHLLVTLENTTTQAVVQRYIRTYFFEVILNALIAYQSDNTHLLQYVESFLKLKCSVEGEAEATIPTLIHGLQNDNLSLALEIFVSVVSDLDSELSQVIISKLPQLQAKMKPAEYSRLITYLVSAHSESFSKFMPLVIKTENPHHPLVEACNLVLMIQPVDLIPFVDRLKQYKPSNAQDAKEADKLVIQTLEMLHKSNPQVISTVSTLQLLVETFCQSGILFRSKELWALLLKCFPNNLKNFLFEEIYKYASTSSDKALFEWIKVEIPIGKIESDRKSVFLKYFSQHIRNICLPMKANDVKPYATHIQQLLSTNVDPKEIADQLPIYASVCQIYLKTNIPELSILVFSYLNNSNVLAQLAQENTTECQQDLVSLIFLLQATRDAVLHIIAAKEFLNFLVVRNENKKDKPLPQIPIESLYGILENACLTFIKHEDSGVVVGNTLQAFFQYVGSQWQEAHALSLSGALLDQLLVQMREGDQSEKGLSRCCEMIKSFMKCNFGKYHPQKIIQFIKGLFNRMAPMKNWENQMLQILTAAENAGIFPIERMKTDKLDPQLRQIAISKLICEKIYIAQCSKAPIKEAPVDLFNRLKDLFLIVDSTSATELQAFLSIGHIIFPRIYGAHALYKTPLLHDFFEWFKTNFLNTTLDKKAVLSFACDILLKVVTYPIGLQLIQKHTTGVNGENIPIDEATNKTLNAIWEFTPVSMPELMIVREGLCSSKNIDTFVTSEGIENGIPSFEGFFKTIIKSRAFSRELTSLNRIQPGYLSLDLLDDCLVLKTLGQIYYQANKFHSEHLKTFLDRINALLDSDHTLKLKELFKDLREDKFKVIQTKK